MRTCLINLRFIIQISEILFPPKKKKERETTKQDTKRAVFVDMWI